MAIDSISVGKAEMNVFHQVVAVGCFSNYSNNSLETKISPFNFSPFTVSTSNFLFVSGCNAYGLFRGRESILPHRNSVFGCISFCEYTFKLENTSCSDGYGCCRTTIPPELTYFNSSLNSLDSNGPLEVGDCSYSFMADKIDFDDNLLRRKDSINESSMFPMVLSWFMTSNKKCGDDLKNSSNYACKEGSSCQIVGLESYRCVCSKGYEGNPYLGCTDVDECARLEDDCEHVCMNKRGGYTCECNPGYYGVGRKNNGTGCIQIKSSNKSIVLLAVGGTTLGISLLLAASYLLYKTIRKRRDKNRRNSFFKKNGGQLLDQHSSNGDSIEKVHTFTAEELNKATDHFNENRVLGRGREGTVYKGMLSNGKIVAVKKSKLADANQVEQFINEVVILSYLDHRNVVKLSYLHSTTSIPVYHRDVKSSNILLDEKYRAKVSDFGISRHISIEQTQLTTIVKGTFGYLDPECFQSSQLTDKSDVYSFGVVLVELLTSRKPISLYWVEEEECHVSLATKFLQSMEDNSLQAILDARVLETARVEEVEVVAKLAQKCLSLDGRKRPTMTQVAMELESIFQTSPLPSLVESNIRSGKTLTAKILEPSSGVSVGSTSFSVDEFPLPSGRF